MLIIQAKEAYRVPLRQCIVETPNYETNHLYILTFWRKVAVWLVSLSSSSSRTQNKHNSIFSSNYSYLEPYLRHPIWTIFAKRRQD